MLRVCFEMGELRRGRLEGCLLPVVAYKWRR